MSLSIFFLSNELPVLLSTTRTKTYTTTLKNRSLLINRRPFFPGPRFVTNKFRTSTYYIDSLLKLSSMSLSRMVKVSPERRKGIKMSINIHRVWYIIKDSKKNTPNLYYYINFVNDVFTSELLSIKISVLTSLVDF